MKKTLIILGAIAAVLLMVSTATAVPTTQSSTTMDYIEKPKQNQPIIDLIKDFPIFNFILKIINFLLAIVNLIGSILRPILSILNFLVGIVSTIVNVLQKIIDNWDIISSIIEFINNLFNPSLKGVDLGPY